MSQYETVEAVQCKLADIYILWPGSPEKPPLFINDEDIFYAEPREFKEPNENGPIFEYQYSMYLRRWFLVKPPKTVNGS